MPGRKPKPTYLKLMDGNPGKRPLNMNEPSPAIELPEAPADLDDLALAEWEQLAPELVKVGCLSAIDARQLALYCDIRSRLVKAKQALKDEYVLAGAGENGGLYQNPLLAVVNKCTEQMMKIAAEFGMTPSSRTKIKVDNAFAAQQESPLLSFAKQKNG